MATTVEIMQLLRPEGGWIIIGDDFDGVSCVDCEPVTKTEFDKAAKTADADIATAAQAAIAKKEAVLAALADATGYTADELREALNA